MQLSQAVDCLKALSNFERRLSFERSNERVGYMIRIEGLTFDSDRKLIRQIADKLGLAVQEDQDSISIL
jgi:hypothetical protein